MQALLTLPSAEIINFTAKSDKNTTAINNALYTFFIKIILSDLFSPKKKKFFIKKNFFLNFYLNFLPIIGSAESSSLLKILSTITIAL